MTIADTTPTGPTTKAELAPLIRLAVPLMVGLMAALLIGVVDTVMISPLGTVPLAAAGITTAVLIIMISALWGLLTVISVQISQAEGAEDPARVALAFRSGMLLCLIGGTIGAALMIAVYPLLGPIGQPQEVLDILLPYWISMSIWIIPFTLFFGLKALFDAVDWPWTAVGLSYIGVVVNIPANYAFIHILDMGILGAGLASILSQSLSLLAAWLVVTRAEGLKPYIQPVTVAWQDVRNQLRDAAPPCLGYAGEGGAYAMIGLMIGWLGAEALAAHQIVNALGGVAYVIPLGMAGAVSIRAGNAVGAGKQARLRPILKASFLMVVLWQAMAASIFIFAGQALAEAMSTDPAVIQLAATLFIIMAMLQIADGVQGTSLGALRGMSDMNMPTIITLIAYWPLALPAAYIMGFTWDLGAIGVWLGYTLGLAIAAIALPWRFWKLTA